MYTQQKQSLIFALITLIPCYFWESNTIETPAFHSINFIVLYELWFLFDLLMLYHQKKPLYVLKMMYFFFTAGCCF